MELVEDRRRQGRGPTVRTGHGMGRVHRRNGDRLARGDRPRESAARAQERRHDLLLRPRPRGLRERPAGARTPLGERDPAEAAVNPAQKSRLRAGRLERLQASMRAHGVESCLLFNEPNVRYATGVSAMPIWSNTTFINCAIVPAEGRPIVFMHGNSVHLFREIEADVRPMHPWEFIDDTDTEATVFAKEVSAALRELGVDASAPLAVDRLGTPGFLALQREGIRLIDSAPVTSEAREVKTAEEIELLELNGRILMEMLGAFEAAI